MNCFSIAVEIPTTPDRGEHAVERYLGLEAAGLRERSVAPGWHRA